ncbi:hypothetical protein ACFQH6_11725 [Halobacteriaceae archaeon GCM10025711]
MPSSRLFVGLAAVVLLAGCLSTGSGADPATTTLQPDDETTQREPATRQLSSILESSDEFEAVLVNDTYVYELGCFDPENDSAVTYIRTGHHYEEASSDAGDSVSVRQATGGEVYRVDVVLSNESVTSIERIEHVPEPQVVRNSC